MSCSTIHEKIQAYCAASDMTDRYSDEILPGCIATGIFTDQHPKRSRKILITRRSTWVFSSGA